MYIIKDWAGNIMNWGTFETFEDAHESIDEHVRQELFDNGINVNLTYGLENDYPEFEQILEKIVSEYTAEYWIDEENNNE